MEPYANKSLEQLKALEIEAQDKLDELIKQHISGMKRLHEMDDLFKQELKSGMINSSLLERCAVLTNELLVLNAKIASEHAALLPLRWTIMKMQPS